MVTAPRRLAAVYTVLLQALQDSLRWRLVFAAVYRLLIYLLTRALQSLVDIQSVQSQYFLLSLALSAAGRHRRQYGYYTRYT